MSRKKGSRFLRIDERIYRSQAWLTLPPTAMKLYMLARMDFLPTRNGRIVITMATLKRKGWRSTSQLRKWLPVLIERGLLAYTRKCGPNVYQRASWLRFTDEPVLEDRANRLDFMRATDDYLKWQLAEPQSAKGPKAEGKKFFAKSDVRTVTSPASGSSLIPH